MKFRKHDFVFLFMLLVSGFVGFQMVIYLLHALLGFNPSWGILQYCVAVFNDQGVIHSVINSGLNVLIAYSFGKLLYVGCRQILLERKWNNYVQANRHHEWTNHFNSKYKHLGQQIIVIEHHSVLAVTSGFTRPKIILSSALVSDFSEREITAIVLHEYCHCRNYDPLRMLIIKIMTDSLPFIPILRRFSHYINVWMELDADSYAVQYLKSPVDLASVLLKCSKMRRQISVGIGFADEAINYRLLRLIEPKKTIHVPLMQFNTWAISLLAIFIISSIIISGCS
ncbi:M56 family metallopeptidase [Paenibacillus alkaliterrae]|uniref:M56 family metallopeptidase n=1 Tax=Paenibacillus alkaliterrae TaxID=320909 RepID=UPI001F3F2AA9|nr:M56 family metallopeptidase [Paenibacillus alkaliterrae]MCF2941457.1 M56 family metallopeptidase [Paenibacillus alkaliterrae]